MVIGELLCDWVLLKLNREQRVRERKKGLDNSGKKREEKRREEKRSCVCERVV